jgi:hypothetical protein
MQTEEHITTGQQNIARQWELIAKLERDKPRRRGSSLIVLSDKGISTQD